MTQYNRNISNLIKDLRNNPIQESKPQQVMGQRSKVLKEFNESKKLQENSDESFAFFTIRDGVVDFRTNDGRTGTQPIERTAEETIKHLCVSLGIQKHEIRDDSLKVKSESKNSPDDKYVVTVFNKGVGKRVNLSIPMSKVEADKFAKEHDADMKMAVPEYQWSKDTKVEKESDLKESKKLQESETTFKQLSDDGDFSVWNTVTYGMYGQNMLVIEIGEKAFELHAGSDEDLRVYKNDNRIYIVSENTGLGNKGHQVIE